MAGTRGRRRNPLESWRAFLARHAPDRGEVASCPVPPPPWSVEFTEPPYRNFDMLTGRNGTEVNPQAAEALAEALKGTGRAER